MKKALVILGGIVGTGIIASSLSGTPSETVRPPYTATQQQVETLVIPEPEPTPAPVVNTPVVVPIQNVTPLKSQSNCSPHYSGCVPIASDVDCAGGSGNGPAYTGEVRVIGSDIYGLDRDGDGWGCE